jgi:hypothetical protein
MRQVSTLLLLCCIALSCKKSDNNSDSSTANFSITGLKDVDLTVTSDGKYSFPVSVVPTSGTKDTVTLFGDLFPSGLYIAFEPRTGVTPFTSVVTVYTDYSSNAGGIFACKVKGTGHSGVRSYDLHVTTDAYRGWQLGSAIYQKVTLTKSSGTTTLYPNITVTSPSGAALRLSFAAGAGLPTVNSTYKIAADTGRNSIRISLYDGPHIWSATGKRYSSSDAATGAFTFDTLHKFTFKCSEVEMSDGTQKMPLSCSFSE